MVDSRSPVEQRPAADATKAPYEPPRVERHGTLRELTNAIMTDAADTGSVIPTDLSA